MRTAIATEMAPRRSSPRHRPPAVLRGMLALAGVGVMMASVVLMLSDRAPGFLWRLSERMDDRQGRAARAAREAASGAPFINPGMLVHVVVWAVAMTVVGLVVWSWRGLAVGAVGVFAFSAILEASQEYLTDTRSAQTRDLIGNGIGIAIGLVVVGLCYLAWDATARALRR